MYFSDHFTARFFCLSLAILDFLAVDKRAPVDNPASLEEVEPKAEENVDPNVRQSRLIRVEPENRRG